MKRISLLDIDFDIDGYLASGGSLMDLSMLSASEKARVVARANTESPDFRARIARYGEFMSLVGAQGAPEQQVGAAITESQLRELWEQTAK